MPNERTADDRLTAYAAIETEQAHLAREAADALFNPKRQTVAAEDQNRQSDATAATDQQPHRVSRILAAGKPQSDPAPVQVTEIPSSKHGRIRTLAAHGMTITQVAEVYAVSESEIQRIVRKPPQAHRSR